MRSVQYWSDNSTQIHTNHKSIGPTSVLHPSYIPHLANKSLQGGLLDEFIHLRLTKPHWTGSDCENICISWCNLANPVWMLGIVIVLANIVGFGCAGLVLLFVDLVAIFQQLRASCRCKSVTSVIRAPCRRWPDRDIRRLCPLRPIWLSPCSFPTAKSPQSAHPNMPIDHRIREISISTVDYIASEHLWFDMVWSCLAMIRRLMMSFSESILVLSCLWWIWASTSHG